MLIRTLPVGPIETNCYVVSDENTLDCAVIDPGAEASKILDYIESFKLKCKHVLLTHAHFDHVGAVPEVMEETGAVLYMHEKDNGTPIGAEPYGFSAPVGTVFVKEGDIIDVGPLKFRVMETPGHTPGGVCFICQDSIFAGDTLFKGSCGRTDFPMGSTKDLMASLYRLCQLKEDYDVYPGHMESTSLEREKRYNYFMHMACDK